MATMELVRPDRNSDAKVQFALVLLAQCFYS